jgi:hypothetical protein
MSDTFKSFFNEILSKQLSQDEINNYDDQFKKIGRKTIEMINNILIREQSLSQQKDTQADVLIVIFLVIFISTAGFLIVNVLKHL